MAAADFFLMKRLSTRRLMTPVDPWVQEQREAQFARNMDAFIRRDFSVIDETMRPEVTLEMPGSSWLAGTYRGLEAVSRAVIAFRQVFDSDKRLVTFVHEGDQMVVRHAISVSGPRHEVEMNLGVRIGYDEHGKFATIDVEPADLDLFDYVVNSRLEEPTP
jgi:ketosteroid isomerase-like protein